MPYYPEEKTAERLSSPERMTRLKRRQKRQKVAAVLAATAVAAATLVALTRPAGATEKEPPDQHKTQSADCKPGEELADNGHLTLGDDSATATFTVKPGCSFVGGFDSWELPEPVYSEPQIQHDRKAGTYGPGDHTLTVSKPRCWQLDLYRGVQPQGDWQYGDRLLASHIGGTKPCKEEPKEETPPPVDKPEEPKDEPIAGTATSKKRTAPKRHRAEPTPDDSPELGTPDQPGTLPFTGPNDVLLPVGLALVAAGAWLLVYTGRRQREHNLAAAAVARALRKPYRGPRETL